MKLIARSSDYRTPPWGVTDQPPFINCAIAVETALSPRALLDPRARMSSARSAATARASSAGDRAPIDIDLLAYDDLALDEPGLTLPHPRLFERAFVLVPLAEIVPDRVDRRAARQRRARGDRRRRESSGSPRAADTAPVLA